MKESALINVQVRLNTADLALQSAVAETAQPINERDQELMEHILEALRDVQLAQEICKIRLSVTRTG